jgi:RNA polymerase sigma factor (TIGR02999 family)
MSSDLTPETQPADEPLTGTVTRLLANLDNGDAAALEEVFPLVYAELRRIAHRHRQQWDGDTTIGTTALVNEAYLRLVDSEHLGARTRVHFLRVASRAMRQILCNYGRDRRAAKRGGAVQPVSLDVPGLAESIPAFSDAQAGKLADLAEALDRLDLTDKRLANVVECRFFGGLSIEETAEALSISPATVKRDWLLARAWLYREMNPA